LDTPSYAVSVESSHSGNAFSVRQEK